MDEGELMQRLERQVVELVGSGRRMIKEFEDRMGEALHAQRLQASEARTEGVKNVQIGAELLRKADEMVRDQGYLIENIKAQWKKNIDQTAKDAGAAQAEAYGESMAKGLKAQLSDIAAKAETSTRRMSWKWIVVAALIGTGCSVAIIAATVGALWAYVPSVSQMDALRADKAKLEASIEALNKRGAKIVIHTCDTGRLCIEADPNQGASYPDFKAPWNNDGGAQLVIPKGY